MKAVSLRNVVTIAILFSFIFCACNQRFLMRKKVRIDNDSTEVDKDYKIIW
ncbi:MAG: hypothetical protein Q8M15_08725 [Bacteroidota bacterium]|nr:hypothetical protein [Bacteroidota bacterium]